MRARAYSLQRDFYCVKCGNKGIPIARYGGMRHEVGHLKKMFCLKCQLETNHAECDDASKYTHNSFKKEFDMKNFDDNGNRIIPLTKLKLKIAY